MGGRLSENKKYSWDGKIKRKNSCAANSPETKKGMDHKLQNFYPKDGKEIRRWSI